MKILLFTPFPPTQGGGSQNIRSALPYLKDVEITWAYLAHRPVEFPNSIHIGRPLLDVGLFASWWNFLLLSLGIHPKIKAFAEKILLLKKQMGAERIWTVAHYEALGVADEVIKKGANVHLSIHDDPPFALIARSKRYFIFTRLCERQFIRVLRGSHTVDVTSHPMAARYEQLYGVKSVAYFPYIHLLHPHKPINDKLTLRIGFLGTLYTSHEAKIFAEALALVQQHTVTPVEWHFWGLGLRQQAWVKKLAVPTILHPFTPEDALVPSLDPMQILYLNYPFDHSSDVLRQTSHCAKLSTYLKAGRSLFAHTPQPSSIADFVNDTGTGVVCSSQDPFEIASSLQILLMNPPPEKNFMKARETWYGEENLKRLNDALLEKLPQ